MAFGLLYSVLATFNAVLLPVSGLKNGFPLSGKYFRFLPNPSSVK